MRFQEIDAEELYDVQGRVLVDVRSPGEFTEGTIPGSVNVPLFSDEERAMIGTVYKQESPAAARRLAMLTVSPKIPQIVEQMEELMKQGELVIYCWRGGMRSYAACTFMELLRYPIKRLRGGFRAYRQLVIERLGSYERLASPVVVLHGMTGVGKTRLLMMLKERGHQVLDLEGMANHRGSVFGAIGLGNPHNQKTFESQLWEAIRELDPQRPVFMEAESRRIGRSVMPEWLDHDKKEGTPVLIQAPVAERVERLMEDYLPHEDESVRAALAVALDTIRKRMSRDDFEQYQEFLNKHQYASFTAKLLEDYYDPKYKHALEGYDGDMITVDAEDLDRAVDVLEALVDRMSREGREVGV